MTLDQLGTALGRIGAAVGGLIAVGGLAIFLLNNEVIKDYLKEAVDVPALNIQLTTLATRVDETKESVEDLSKNVQELTKTFSDIQSIGELSKEPVLKFLEGGHITDGPIGGTVSFTIRSIKLRECGTARVRVWFKNGSQNVHAFENISILDKDGNSVRIPADPGSILERSFTARIPNRSGVTPGVAVGWIETDYPTCPYVPVAVSNAMAFNILDEDGRPVERERPNERN